MPELPEVEFQLRYFQKTALGAVIRSAKVFVPGLIKSSAIQLKPKSNCARVFEKALRGRRMVDAYRRGKYLIVKLDRDRALILHFGMGGDLRYYRNDAERPDYTRIEFRLANDWRLAFTCPRNICRVMLVNDPAEVQALREMGPEPLDRGYTLGYLRQAIGSSKGRCIKPLLMDQRRIAGIGNIYADQILFESQVRPDRKAASLTDAEIRSVFSATRRVIRKAIRTAHLDEFPVEFLVSRRARSRPCPKCAGTIERKRISGRTAHYCAACQR